MLEYVVIDDICRCTYFKNLYNGMYTISWCMIFSSTTRKVEQCSKVRDGPLSAVSWLTPPLVVLLTKIMEPQIFRSLRTADKGLYGRSGSWR